MPNEKQKIEALLFASARRLNVEEIAQFTCLRDIDKIKLCLQELKAEYDAGASSMMILNEGDVWKMTVKDHYQPIVRRVVSQTELDKPLMQTLAVVAWKYPVLQADVIKIRHNKAYDHLKVLENMGFITRQMFGRTKKITLTQRFFEYFDLPTKEEARELFKGIMPEYIQKKIVKDEKDIDEAERKIDDARLKKAMLEEQRRKEKEQKKDAVENAEEKEIKEPKEKTAEAEGNVAEKKEEKTEAAKESAEEMQNITEEKKELAELEEKEEEKLEEAEADIKEIQKEEDKNVYSNVPEVQASDEVPESEAGSERKE
jgi:segregation and condensation protein B